MTRFVSFGLRSTVASIVFAGASIVLADSVYAQTVIVDSNGWRMDENTLRSTQRPQPASPAVSTASNTYIPYNNFQQTTVISGAQNEETLPDTSLENQNIKPVSSPEKDYALPESPVPRTVSAINQEREDRLQAHQMFDCAAQPDQCEDPAPWDADYLQNFYEVPWEMAKRPFDLSERALIIDAIALGGFGLLYLIDEDIRDEALDQQSSGADDIFDVAEVGGRFFGLLAAGAGTWAAGEVVGDRSLQRAGLNSFQSVLIAALPVEGTKALFGRSRPLKDQGNDDWFGSGNSFISGHTTYAFAAASAFAHEYAHTGWVPYLAYGAAGMVGAQRIYDDKHWASDVFISALVGWGIGQAVSDAEAFKQDSPFALGPMRTAVARERGAQGVSLALEF